MHLLSGLGLGACLADDMGLGKTIQVLSLLLVQTGRETGAAAEPAGGAGSLLANWAAEIEKFAPGLKAVIVHPSAMTAEQIRQFTPEQAADLIWRSPAMAPCCVSRRWSRDPMALCHSGRGAGDQESERQADQSGQGAEGAGADRADRDAGRKSPGRPVVDLRFHQSGSAGNARSSSPLRQEPGRARRTIPTARCASWCGPTSCGG